MERYFQISFHALILAAFIALAGTGRLDIPSVVLFLIFFGITANRALKARPALLTARAAFLMSLGYIFFFVFDATILSRSFVTASIHLVLFLELAKLAQEKEDKDYLYLIILAFLQVLAASSLTIDMSFILTLFLFLVALVSTLMSYDIYRSQRESGGTGDVEIDGPLGGMSLWASTWIVILGLALFFVIPRVGTGYFSRAASQALLLSGFTESVELGEIGRVKLSSALVMRARLLEGTPSAIPKWRGITLDAFDGQRWYQTNRRRRRLSSLGNGGYFVSGMEGVGERVRYEIFLEPLATTTLFGPHSIRAVTGNFRGLDRDDADSVYKRAQAVRRTRYETVSEIPLRTVFEEIPDDIPSREAAYLQLPDDLDPRIVELAETITDTGTTVLEKASLVETHLKRNYAYSLELTWDPGDEPLATFLFDAQSGHCEYFASSMAILLRAIGVPTRMVNGFLAGEFNAIGGSYIIRQSDAHSWVEAYVPGRGWVEFDPTPPDPNREEISLAVLLSHYVDAAELFWNSYILTYDTGTQIQLFTGAQEAIRSAQRDIRRRSDRWVVLGQAAADRLVARIRGIVEAAWFWATGFGLVAAGFAYRHRRELHTRWKIWRLGSGKGTADLDVVSRMFYRAAKLAAPRDQARKPHQTWREWAAHLPEEGPRAIISTALVVFERARYGDGPVTIDDYAALEQALRQLRS